MALTRSRNITNPYLVFVIRLKCCIMMMMMMMMALMVMIVMIVMVIMIIVVIAIMMIIITYNKIIRSVVGIIVRILITITIVL